MNEEELRKFKKEHGTFIAAGTTLIIVGIAAGMWKMMKKYCHGKKNCCGGVVLGVLCANRKEC
ncbi:MAG: hypothetical protein LUH58_11010 [Lachnospiraceae bacterium]|nr:hypothetical protein [Lachnospiraceae bacterium]